MRKQPADEMGEEYDPDDFKMMERKLGYNE